ncbi:energy transducer TonB [Flavobacterium johnsoniae]|uniref:energy transducer TonB n=1 Tax=Flavobacterium johnsoniae TaxID=986 RepID=UPI003D982767
MKKFLILVLICFVQNAFSQSAKKNSKAKESETKESEIPIVKVNTSNYNDADLVVDEPNPSFLTIKNDDKTIYNTAGLDVKPDFPGGIEKFNKFFHNNFHYSDEEYTDLKGKKIYATFVIEQDGALTDIKILRDAGYKTGAEAIRVLKKCPKWIPGELKGKKVRVLYSIPLTIN